ncbi:MAG: amino acid kinase family protein [Promethearchaeota archaeon]
MSLTDVEGIYKDFNDDASLIKLIKFHQLEDILEHLDGGMKKKAYVALEAFKKGIKKVIICSGLTETPILDALEKNAGTVITYE